jgi:hypothetical protein
MRNSAAGQLVHENSPGFIDGPLPQQDFGNRPLPRLAPGPKRGDELGLVDQAALERDQAKDEIA